VKRYLGLAIRILGGIALLVLVISQIDFRDRYVAADGEESRGRILERDIESLRFADTDDAESTIPVETILFRLRAEDGKKREGTPTGLTAREADGAPLTGLPLAIDQHEVHLRTATGVRTLDRPALDDAVVVLEVGDTVEEVPLASVIDLQPEIYEGLITIGGRLKWPLAIGSSIFFFVISWLGVWRWRFLMKTQGLDVSLLECFRLTYLGFFFNNVVPGLTGGDLVKAFYVARRSPGARATAAVSVFVDRIIGIVGLAFLGGSVLVFRLGDPQYRAAAIVIYVFLACAAVGGVMFFSRRIRRWCRIDRLFEILPGAPGRILRKIDRAFFAYRENRTALLVAFLLSIVNHTGLMVMNIGFARSLGIDDVPVTAFFVLIPVIMMISSIPLLPGGWGIGELAYATFLGYVGVPYTQAIALSFLFRISNLVWSLLGGVFFMTGRDRVTQEELEREAELEDEAMGVTEPE